MNRYLDFARLFFRLFGDLVYFKGVDKLTFWDWLYKRRIGFGTAWKYNDTF